MWQNLMLLDSCRVACLDLSMNNSPSQHPIVAHFVSVSVEARHHNCRCKIFTGTNCTCGTANSIKGWEIAKLENWPFTTNKGLESFSSSYSSVGWLFLQLKGGGSVVGPVDVLRWCKTVLRSVYRDKECSGLKCGVETVCFNGQNIELIWGITVFCKTLISLGLCWVGSADVWGTWEQLLWQ